MKEVTYVDISKNKQGMKFKQLNEAREILETALTTLHVLEVLNMNIPN